MNDDDEYLMTGEERLNYLYSKRTLGLAESPDWRKRSLAWFVLAPGALSIWATALVLGIIYLLTLIPAP